MAEGPSDVVIVGGGVIGLSIAWVLTRAGARVTVLDRQAVGRAASWAGAGMIPPYAERLTTNPTLELRSWSALLYPEWSSELREATGIDNGWDRTGGVDVAATESEADELRSMTGRWRLEHVVYERMGPKDFARVEPALNPELSVAYYLPDRAQIRNPRHLRALEAAFVAWGGRILADSGAIGFDRSGDRVVAVRTSGGSVACGSVVIAAGAWSSGLLAGLGADVPTPPIRGQIVLLRSDRPLIRRIVEHGRMYLVPRRDGRVLVGATEEDAGFDDGATEPAARDLRAEAVRLCPVLADAEVETTWAGLRPGSRDSRPYLGWLPGWRNVVVASGHKRSGIQLAPASAEVVADLVLGRPPQLDLSPFRVDREASEGGEATFRS